MRKDGGFKEEGNWYKGNLHSHTVDSDGCLTPGEAVELFAEHGYRAFWESAIMMCIRTTGSS